MAFPLPAIPLAAQAGRLPLRAKAGNPILHDLRCQAASTRHTPGRSCPGIFMEVNAYGKTSRPPGAEPEQKEKGTVYRVPLRPFPALLAVIGRREMPWIFKGFPARRIILHNGIDVPDVSLKVPYFMAFSSPDNESNGETGRKSIRTGNGKPGFVCGVF